MDNIKDYCDTVKAPWGKIFYDLLFEQLNIAQYPKLKILDFGSGHGATSNYFAACHDITAVEPNEEMIENSIKENTYVQIHGGIEQVKALDDNIFDIIFCHNVLEYIEVKEPIIETLTRVLKPEGLLSVVKHNRIGRVIHTAVFRNNPQKALSLLDANAKDSNNYLGTQHIYSNDDLIMCVEKHGCKLTKILGMRAFYALGQDNTVKFTEEWYTNMLELEKKVAEIDEYKQAAFLNHLTFEKCT